MMEATLATCALLAAGFDWLEALLPFFFVAFWIVSQVFAVLRRLQGGGRQPAPPPRPRFDPARDRPRLPQPAPEPAGDLRSELEKQIAEFLREATGDRNPEAAPRDVRPAGPVRPVRQAEPPRPQTPRREQRSERDRRGGPPPRAATSKPLARQQQAKDQKKVVVPREVAGQPPVTGSIERPQAEVSVARHVQDVFSRELTHLRGTISGEESSTAGGTPRRTAPTQAEELVHLLRSPATIRQVMLLREILDRPVDRW